MPSRNRDDESAPDGAARAGPRRGLIFATLAGACALAAGAYVTAAALRQATPQGGPLGAPIQAGDDAASAIAMVGGETGSVLFQNLVPGAHWRQVGAIELGGPEWPRTMLPLACRRVHYAADRGLCLAENPGPLRTYAAYVFGPDFRALHKLPLAGLPSRVRIAPDGRLGATTVFVSGHSYAEAGFSTETNLIELATGAKLVNLEAFTVFRDGKQFRSVDFNFWGVTFKPDGNGFYATLATGGATYLVEGRADTREATVLRENVECPSLSPDATRIAFKKRVGGGLGTVYWRFQALDLATGRETALAETRSIDDQIEWLDNDRVLYTDGTDVWAMAADGSGAPQRFMSQAVSPAVVRTAMAMPANGAGSGATGEALSLPPADLGVQAAAPSAARTGADVSYELTITNHGPSDASNLRLEHDLPKGVLYRAAETVALDNDSWGCTMVPEENRFTCDTTALPSGSSWVVKVTLASETAGAFESRARIYAAEPDPSPANNEAKVSLAVN